MEVPGIPMVVLCSIPTFAAVGLAFDVGEKTLGRTVPGFLCCIAAAFVIVPLVYANAYMALLWLSFRLSDVFDALRHGRRVSCRPACSRSGAEQTSKKSRIADGVLEYLRGMGGVLICIPVVLWISFVWIPCERLKERAAAKRGLRRQPDPQNGKDAE